MPAESDGVHSLDLRIFASIVEESPTTVMITDPLGNIQYVNGKFTQLTGFTRAEVMGRNPSFKSGHPTAQRVRHLWQTIASGGRMAGRALQPQEKRRAVLGACQRSRRSAVSEGEIATTWP